RITQICEPVASSDLSGASRDDVNAMYSPSGDHRGEPNVSLPRVSCHDWPSATRVIQRFDIRLLSSRSTSPFTQTTCLPSGEMAKLPAVSLYRMSSTVQRDWASADSGIRTARA